MKTQRILAAIAVSLAVVTLSGALRSHALAAQNCQNCNLDTETCITRVLFGFTECTDIPGVFCSLSGSQCIGRPGSVAAISPDGSVRPIGDDATIGSPISRHRLVTGRGSVTESRVLALAGSRMMKRSCNGIILRRGYVATVVAQLRAKSEKLVL